MVQKQLVDYIKSQQALGASSDAIRSALTGAGWPPLDVEDSLKSIEPGAPASVSSSPASISVNDLVSGFKPRTEAPATPKKSVDPVEVMTPAHPDHPAHHLHIGYVVLAVIAAALIAVLGLLYMKYSALQSQVSAVNDRLTSANSQVSSLTSQVSDLTQSRDALNAQVKNLTQSNSQYSGELFFFLTPTSTASGTPAISFRLSGLLSTTTRGYVLATADGLKLTVLNSQSDKIKTVLDPLAGNTVEISGTHLPGSREVTVASVNGASF